MAGAAHADDDHDDDERAPATLPGVGLIPALSSLAFEGSHDVPADGSVVGGPVTRNAEYLLVATGSYTWNASGAVADAECSTEETKAKRLVPHLAGAGSSDLRDLLVQGRPLEHLGSGYDWIPATGSNKACDKKGHTYFATFRTESTQLALQIADDRYDDNAGSLQVSLFRLAEMPDAVGSAVRPGTDVATLTVDASDGAGASTRLDAGVYRLEATGTWTDASAPGGHAFDAECGTTPYAAGTWPDSSDVWLRDPYPPEFSSLVPDRDATGVADLAVTVGGVATGGHWVAPSATAAGCDEVDHRYETFVDVGVGGAELRVTPGDLAGGHADNAGTLSVAVRRVGPADLPAAATGYVGTVPVSARSDRNTGIWVDPARAHLLVVRGTFAYRPLAEADAMCHASGASVSFVLQDQLVDFAPDGCQHRSHTYWVERPAGAPGHAMRIHDRNWADNFGHLFVHVFATS